jgi:hypothetical protein
MTRSKLFLAALILTLALSLAGPSQSVMGGPAPIFMSAAAAAEEGEGGYEEKPWWKFTGWESAFTVLAGLYFAAALQVLPRILAERSDEEEHH